MSAEHGQSAVAVLTKAEGHWGRYSDGSLVGVKLVIPYGVKWKDQLNSSDKVELQ